MNCGLLLSKTLYRWYSGRHCCLTTRELLVLCGVHYVLTVPLWVLCGCSGLPACSVMMFDDSQLVLGLNVGCTLPLARWHLVNAVAPNDPKLDGWLRKYMDGEIIVIFWVLVSLFFFFVFLTVSFWDVVLFLVSIVIFHLKLYLPQSPCLCFTVSVSCLIVSLLVSVVTLMFFFVCLGSYSLSYFPTSICPFCVNIVTSSSLSLFVCCFLCAPVISLANLKLLVSV